MNMTFFGMINNIVLLIALSVIYEISYSFHENLKKSLPFINGILIGLIGIAIMALPFQFTEGIFFDARTILIGVAALMFGGTPTLIAVIITVAYRVFVGGDGVYMGVATILSSAAIGLFWRKYVFKKTSRRKWLNIYLMGITIHIVMIFSVYLLPPASRSQIFSAIDMPIITIYPVATVLLSLLLLRQKERNNAVSAILEAENRYKSLFDSNYAIMLLVDPENGQIMDANNAASIYYGWSVNQLKRMNISDINVLPFNQIKIEMQNAATKQRNYFLFKHKKSSGQIVDVEVYSGPIQFKEKTLIYSIIHDVSERSSAIQALKESEYRFRTLVEGCPDAVIMLTSEGNIAFINNVTLQLLGAENSDELVGSPMNSRVHPDYLELANQRRDIENQKKPAHPIEALYLRMDGSPVWVEVQSVPISYNDKEAALLFVRDISERKRQEAANLEIEAQLRQQQKLEAIGTLAGGVAHEINNPINGIMNYAQLILDSIGENAVGSDYAREIIRESERISEIVKNLLQFSRIEKQSHSYASIVDIINQTVSLILTVIKKDQIHFQISLQENLPEIKCRSQQIQQVLMNLLTNARDALNEKYPEYDPDKVIHLSCVQIQSEGRRWIRIIVEDHGNGIPNNIREKIFEPFFSTKTKDKGTGLGLSISFGIVKDHHGKLFINTKEGAYTRFYLELPVDNGWDLKESKQKGVVL